MSRGMPAWARYRIVLNNILGVNELGLCKIEHIWRRYIMDSITNIILSGVIYDLLKEGTKLSFQNVFGKNFFGNGMGKDINTCEKFLQEIDEGNDLLQKEKNVQRVLSADNEYADIFDNVLYNTNFAKRLDYIIYIMNSSRTYERKINIEYLGEFLGFTSANELMKYYKNAEEPTYEFCEDVADKMGVNPQWLKNGDIGEAMFTTRLPRIYSTEQILEYDNLDEFDFHFVIKNATKREIIIVRKYNELKYEYYPCQVVFNTSVGGSGRSYLLSFYKFLKSLDTRGKNDITNVHVVSKELFDEILIGKAYCGVIQKYNAQGKASILDDFLDVYHRYFSIENYEMWYGKEFVEVQKIVAIMLDNEKGQ